MKFADLTPYQIDGFTMRLLNPEDKPKMIAIRDAVMAVLPDPRWYFSMDDWEIDEWLGQNSVVGHVHQLVLQGRRTGVDNQNFHGYLLQKCELV